MGDYPVFVFFMPLVGLGLMGFFLIFGKKMMQSTEKKYPQFRVDALAQQMGLQLVEGDPAMNMLQASLSHDDQDVTPLGGKVRRFMGDQAQETRILMRGAPRGRPIEFVYYLYSERNDRVAVVFHKRDFECRLSVQVPVNVPAFEIVGRKAPPGFKPEPEWDLPQQSFGDRNLDSRLRLTSADPRLGPHLAPVAVGLTGHRFVHVQGFKTVIQSICTEEATMYAMMDLLKTQEALERLANALAGPVRAG